MIKMSELREKDTEALRNLEKELEENLFATRLQKRTGQLDNTAKVQQTRRELARIKTVLRARELGLEVIETPSPEDKAKREAAPKGAGKKASKPATAKAKAKAKSGKKPAAAKGKSAKPAAKAKTKKTAAKKSAKPAAKKKAAGGKK